MVLKSFLAFQSRKNVSQVTNLTFLDRTFFVDDDKTNLNQHPLTDLRDWG